MCFGGGKKEAARSRQDADRAREEAAAQEADRQRRVTEGQGLIDKNFSQFDDTYYGGYADSYSGNYLPQLDTQYADAKDKLIASLAGQGTLESSVGASRLSDLDRTYNDERVAIGGRAQDAVSQLRGQVEGNKSSLYGLNTASADPAGIAARATSEATALRAPQSFSSLGQVFASVLQPLAAFNSADASSINPSMAWNKAPTYTAPGTANSGRVVQ